MAPWQAGQYLRLKKTYFHLCASPYLISPYQFVPTDMQAVITPVETLQVPSRTKPIITSRSSAPPVHSGSKPHGMQLGGLRWGRDDINAGADDRSMCSSCFPKYHLFNAPFTRVDEFEGAPAGLNAVGWAGGYTDVEDPYPAFEDPAPPPVPISAAELTSPPEFSPLQHHHQSRHLRGLLRRDPHVLGRSPSPSPCVTPLEIPPRVSAQRVWLLSLGQS